jgi:hypothetical protein
MLRLATDPTCPTRLCYQVGGVYRPPKLKFMQRMKATIKWFAPFTNDPSKITKGDFIRLFWLLEKIYGSEDNRINIPNRLFPDEAVFRRIDDARVVPDFLWKGAIDSIEILGFSTHTLERCGIPDYMRTSYDLLDADAQSTALHKFVYVVKKAIGELPEQKFLYLCKLFLSGILLKPIWILVFKNSYSREARSWFCDAVLWPRWVTLRQTAFAILLEAMGLSLLSINIPTHFATGRSKYHEPVPARWPKISGLVRQVIDNINPDSD